ncbi:MAG TPA: N-acetylmuramic acid 6-phosphate etherase [Pyrinomonadaceae bacterium]|nr:N-acetylmuramic acid 6-phosphate etherase [Pyrinomonadaceae bacterium]
MNDLPVTEQENPRTKGISALGADEIVRLMNEEDALVAEAVGRVGASVAQAVDGIVARLRGGGRLFYVGTGTSGRLGVLDAVECPPTFGVSPELVQGIIAGGYNACHRAVEASEDDRVAGARDLDERGMTGKDAVVGIAASGRTPYTVGAVEHARTRGAFTACVACVAGSAITRAVEVAIVPVVGPEVIAGSTRLKAGTAQKMVLNMLSTATMIRLGYVSGNRMTNVSARNEKLRERARRIFQAETGLDEAAASAAFAAAGDNLPTALVMQRTGRTRAEAEAALAAGRGTVSAAIEQLLQSGEHLS